jgi:CO dehydrogenase/acetyl-CoA synthase delta subunit
MKKPYITGWRGTEAGEVPQVTTVWKGSDRWGAFRARWAFNRMNYRVDPGIYAVGEPGPDSIVLVSANYKLSFDVLRRELKGLDAWIMVLDTMGINVWCAAGKGTFGTEEIVNRIEETGLKKIINHRKLIIPQLGGPGVAAHIVKKHSGFSVIYGPVRACDLPRFLDADMAASPDMRRVRFSFHDRLVLVPVEVVTGFKFLLIAMAGFFLLAGLNRNGYSGAEALTFGLRSTVNLLFAYLAGTVIGPLLLPWLPGRSFSVKGILPGVALFLISFFTGFTGRDPLEIIAWMFLIPAISSFATMNFTGASTYTSLSGVKKEMSIAVPLQIIAVIIGIGLWIANRYI